MVRSPGSAATSVEILERTVVAAYMTNVRLRRITELKRRVAEMTDPNPETVPCSEATDGDVDVEVVAMTDPDPEAVPRSEAADGDGDVEGSE